ncbi:MAG: class I SAM-dependent methyltransferase [Aquabacterium sp.]
MNAPVSFNAPPPALVVISGGPASPRATSGDAPDGAFQRLLQALPAAQRVLEIGCGAGQLAQAYRRQHPGSTWIGIERRAELVKPAARHMTQALHLDLNRVDVSAVQGPFDLIVVNRLEHLPNAPKVLADLGRVLAPQGTLIVRAENHARLSALARLIEADPSTGVPALPDDPASLDEAHPRFQSHSTIYKMLMDAGWMPTLADHEPDDKLDDRMAAAARYMGETLDVPQGCADRVHRMKHLILRATRPFDDQVPASSHACFDVVVPTTKEQQLRVNVEQSPGLSEVGARIVSYRRAASPAEVLSESLRHVQTDWVLLCHQDIYFPKGFGQRLNALLSSIPAEQRASTLIGFAGMGINRQTEQPEPAGYVIDRLNVADYPASNAVVSIDELALVVARDSIHKIDPHIGWHLWATDLCLTSICTHRVFPRIVKMPIYHNTQSGWQLPDSFFDSVAYLRQKFPQFDVIHSLCGTLDKDFVQRNRSPKA